MTMTAPSSPVLWQALKDERGLGAYCMIESMSEEQRRLLYNGKHKQYMSTDIFSALTSTILKANALILTQHSSVNPGEVVATVRKYKAMVRWTKVTVVDQPLTYSFLQAFDNNDTVESLIIRGCNSIFHFDPSDVCSVWSGHDCTVQHPRLIHLKKLTLSQYTVSADDLENVTPFINRCPNLVQLTLAHFTGQYDVFTILSKLTEQVRQRLHTLSIHGSTGDALLSFIASKCPNLTHLDVSYQVHPDQHPKPHIKADVLLSTLTKLKYLNISGNVVRISTLDSLQTMRPRLNIVRKFVRDVSRSDTKQKVCWRTDAEELRPDPASNIGNMSFYMVQDILSCEFSSVSAIPNGRELFPILVKVVATSHTVDQIVRKGRHDELLKLELTIASIFRLADDENPDLVVKLPASHAWKLFLTMCNVWYVCNVHVHTQVLRVVKNAVYTPENDDDVLKSIEEMFTMLISNRDKKMPRVEHEALRCFYAALVSLGGSRRDLVKLWITWLMDTTEDPIRSSLDLLPAWKFVRYRVLNSRNFAEQLFYVLNEHGLFKRIVDYFSRLLSSIQDPRLFSSKVIPHLLMLFTELTMFLPHMQAAIVDMYSPLFGILNRLLLLLVNEYIPNMDNLYISIMYFVVRMMAIDEPSRRDLNLKLISSKVLCCAPYISMEYSDPLPDMQAITYELLWYMRNFPPWLRNLIADRDQMKGAENRSAQDYLPPGGIDDPKYTDRHRLVEYLIYSNHNRKDALHMSIDTIKRMCCGYRIKSVYIVDIVVFTKAVLLKKKRRELDRHTLRGPTTPGTSWPIDTDIQEQRMGARESRSKNLGKRILKDIAILDIERKRSSSQTRLPVSLPPTQRRRSSSQTRLPMASPPTVRRRRRSLGQIRLPVPPPPTERVRSSSQTRRSRQTPDYDVPL